eukprot:TRINITY_DN5669_c0_g1_i1.p1 TRINITY_DN5669_c0_g1~~TRINITY_DN5669_c0_g1_i1.p1  ORF type:complete len:875 (+),score=205.88 TRINITY_DN5669_c0_g1_i1:254-2878(+)
MPVVWVVQEGYGADDALKVTIPEGCDVCDLLQKAAGMFSFGDIGTLLPSQLQLFVFGKQVSTRKLISQVKTDDPDADLTFEIRPKKGEIENAKAFKEAKARKERSREKAPSQGREKSPMGRERSPMPQARHFLSSTHRHPPPKKPKTASSGRSVTRTFSTPRKILQDPPAPSRVFTSRHEPPRRASSPPAAFHRSKSNSRTPHRSPLVARRSSEVLKIPHSESTFGNPRRFGDTLSRSRSRRGETDTFAVPIGFSETFSGHSRRTRRGSTSYERNDSSDVAPKPRLEDEIHRKKNEEEKKRKEIERKKRIEDRRRRHREEEHAEELRRKHELELAKKLEHEEKTRRAEDRRTREQAARLKVEKDREKKKLAKSAKELIKLEKAEGAARHKISELQMAPWNGFAQDHASEKVAVAKKEKAKKKRVLQRRTTNRVTIAVPESPKEIKTDASDAGNDKETNLEGEGGHLEEGGALEAEDLDEIEEVEEVEEATEATEVTEEEEDDSENALEQSMQRARIAVQLQEEREAELESQRKAACDEETNARSTIITEEEESRTPVEQAATENRKRLEEEESTALVLKLMQQEEEQLQQMQQMAKQREEEELKEALALAKLLEEEEARNKEEEDKRKRKEEYEQIKSEEELRFRKSIYKGDENLIVLMRHSIRHDLGGFDKVPISIWPDKHARPYDPPISDVDLPLLAAMKIRKYRIQRIISSPFRRCLETAGIVARYLEIHTVHVDDRLGEWYREIKRCCDAAKVPCRGLQRLSRDDAEKELGGAPLKLGSWHKHDVGEQDITGLLRRVATAIPTIADSVKGQNTLLVTHGDICNRYLPEADYMPDYSYLKLHESGFVTIGPPYYGRARPEDIIEEYRTDQM